MAKYWAPEAHTTSHYLTWQPDVAATRGPWTVRINLFEKVGSFRIAL